MFSIPLQHTNKKVISMSANISTQFLQSGNNNRVYYGQKDVDKRH